MLLQGLPMTTPNTRIVPHLWFDTQAVDAAEFYTAMFPDSRITAQGKLTGTPSGDCDLVSFELWGMPFEAISAGPMFTINPSVSFIVNFDPLFFGKGDTAKQKALDTQATLWENLCEGGQVLMPLDTYPFSERFGFMQDKFGVSWQLMLTNPEGDPRPPIVPALLFVNDSCGQAEAAVDFYLSVFPESRLGGRHFYPAGMPPNREGTVMFSDFQPGNYWLAAMDGGGEHAFGFNEGVSFMVYCDDQAAINHFWQALNANPEGGQCGWLKDKFGVSWQIVPKVMHRML
jgi:predicted 3-demethylubiquinone-9 3-methyltransferase (glyoxalase superfamily)